MQTLIRNALIINEGTRFPGNILIRDGRISKVIKDNELYTPRNNLITFDAGGKWVLPGVIDDQVHFREPGLVNKGDFYSESKAAVAGGVTSVMDMPNTKPQTITQTDLENKFIMASGKSLANYSFYFGATNENIEEVLQTDPSKVCGVKVFMGSSTGNMLVDKPESLEKIFSASPCLVAVHCEDEAIIRKNSVDFKNKYGANIPVKYHPVIRSEKACYLSSSLAVKLAQKHNTRLHILHLSTSRELSLFDHNIPLKEKRITAEVCVHHLWFDDSDYERLGTKIKWNPAIKTKNDRKKLLEGVLNDKIDVIATDHAPHTMEEKNNSYFMAPSGGPLVQHSLVAMLELTRTGILSVEKVVEKMCHAPADLFRIEKRGYIKEGYWADLVIIDPDKAWKVKKDNILYKCGWSPFEGVTFHNKIMATFVNGNLVYNDGIFDESAKGIPLRFLI